MNILLFGPNGSGKGTQGAVVQKKFNVAHVESGVIFRENIKKGTALGKKGQRIHRPRRAGSRRHHHPHDPGPAEGERLRQGLAPGRLSPELQAGQGAGRSPGQGGYEARLCHRDRPGPRNRQEPHHGAQALRQRQQPSQQCIHRRHQAGPEGRQTSSAGSAAANSSAAPTTRTRSPSANAMTSTTTSPRGPWPP